MEKKPLPRGWSTRRLRAWAGHGRHTAVVQSVKAAVAAVLAWILVDHILGLPQPFLAPYAAVFMIEVTVSRSLRVAGEQLAAVSLGVVLAAAVGALVDSITVGVGVTVLVGLLLGRWRRFGSSGVWVAVTALLMVTYGDSDQPGMLGERILEIALGAATGVAVNALLLPPLYLARSERALTGLGSTATALLHDVARELREPGTAEPGRWNKWSAEVRWQLDDALDAVAWTEESARGNLRRSATPAAAGTQWRRSVVTLSEGWPLCTEIVRAAQLAVTPHPPFGPLAPEIRDGAAAFLESLADLIRAEFAFHDDREGCRTAARTAEAQLRGFEDAVACSENPTRGSSMSAGSLLRPCSAALRLLTGESAAVHGWRRR
ncbi:MULTISPECIES: aromatic acid exporter family protein [unclassified Rhodococcus (in: high G+C Gram-positive bacteria)]|uniref:FUSC family protein n=1 Tax=unclassified Rhodococcus (in: high G+C Gram-positive bacteria) TaxID=192944 RepID=UPI002078C206|nr:MULTISPECIES: FUSC family protein [unclassified Rhodococcus (in: high G+C Gram-positive bacteria)]